MKIPSRDECYRLLDKFNFPETKKKHIRLVTKIAEYLGKKLKLKGKKLDLDLVFAGAILHDIDKGIMEKGDIHTDKGDKILQEEGYPEVARICVSHRVDAFLNENTRPKTWEERIVALADKMATTEVTSVDERFKKWNEEFLPEKQKEVFRKSYPLIKKLEMEILTIIGMTAEEVKTAINS